MTDLTYLYPDPKSQSDLKNYLIEFIKKNINDFSYHEENVTGWFGKQSTTRTFKHPKISFSMICKFTKDEGCHHIYLINDKNINEIFNTERNFGRIQLLSFEHAKNINDWYIMPDLFFSLIDKIKEEIKLINNRKQIIDLLDEK